MNKLKTVGKYNVGKSQYECINMTDFYCRIIEILSDFHYI